MQKLYLLLRNNRQAGPYSLEELLAQELKPFDLVWVEGKSAAWRYPGEIESLKELVPPTPASAQRFEPISTELLDKESTEQKPVRENSWMRAKKIFVALPKEIEKRQQAGEGSPNFSKPPTEDRWQQAAATSVETLHTNYRRSVSDIEESYTNWVVEKKIKKAPAIPKKELVTAAGVLVILFLGFKIFNGSNDTAGEVAPPAVVLEERRPSDQKAVSEIPDAASRELVTQPAAGLQTSQKSALTKKRLSNTVIPTSRVLVSNNAKVENNEKQASSAPAVINTPPSEPSETVPEKKRKFGQVLKGIFSKKETAPGETADGRREAVHRTEPGVQVASAEQIEALQLSDNSGGSWMMGVSGIKLTLKNKNAEKLEKALVTVSYFDGNNELIERKTIVFNNVPAGAKSTMAVPDHKFADHVQARISSASMGL